MMHVDFFGSQKIVEIYNSINALQVVQIGKITVLPTLILVHACSQASTAPVRSPADTVFARMR